MIQVNPLSLTLKPVPRAYTAKDYPLKRGFNAVQYFELSGAALLTQAEKDALDQQYRWDAWAVLDVLGLSHYVARNKTQPKHTVLDCHLYQSTFEFELKPLGIPSSGVPMAHDFAGMPSPPIDGFAENRVEFRTAQQFSSGRNRQVGKRLGYLRDVSYSQPLTPSEAARFVTFYREYDHEPLTSAWITAYFGTGRKLVFGQQPWELKATGSHFELSVQGYIV